MTLASVGVTSVRCYTVVAEACAGWLDLIETASLLLEAKYSTVAPWRTMDATATRVRTCFPFPSVIWPSYYRDHSIMSLQFAANESTSLVFAVDRACVYGTSATAQVVEATNLRGISGRTIRPAKHANSTPCD